MGNRIKRIFASMFIMLVTCGIAGAQCSFEFDVEVIQHSFCTSDGIVKVISNDETIDLSNVFITIANDGINEMSSENGHSFGSLPPGEYTVTFQSVCMGTMITTHATKKVTVQSEYNIVQANMAGVKRSSLNCISSGKVSLNIYDGRPPYTIEIISKPDAYTGETVFEADAYNEIENLPPGNYAFVASDACFSDSKPVNVTIDKLESDFPTDPYSAYFNPSGCSQAYIDENPGVGGWTHEYWSYYRHMYEVAFTFDETKNWSSDFSNRMYFNLPKTYNEMYAEGAKMKIYLRLKDTECEEVLVEEVQFSDPPQNYIYQYYEKPCEGYNVSFYLGNENLLCSPFKWEIFEESDPDTPIDSETDIEYFYTQSIKNLQYNKTYTIKVTDNNNTTITSEPIIQQQDDAYMWYWSDGHRHNYNYDLAYEINGKCGPYKIEIRDTDDNLITTLEDITDVSGIIEGLEYDRGYTINLFDNAERLNYSFYYIEDSPDRYVFWYFGGGGDDGPLSCENYSVVAYPVNLNIPYTWKIMAKDDEETVLFEGTVENADDNILPSLMYNVKYIIEFTDDIHTPPLREEIYQTDAVVSQPVIWDYGDAERTCDDYAFMFKADNIYCRPYKWEVVDSDENIVYQKQDLTDFEVETVRLKYDMQYTITVTDEKGNHFAIYPYRYSNEVSPHIYWWNRGDDELQCYDYRHWFQVSDVRCFPYKWEVFNSDDELVDSETGILETDDHYHHTRLEYNKEYTIIVTDKNGQTDKYTCIKYQESTQINFYHYSEMLSCYPYEGYIYLYGQFDADTRIQYVSGPQTPVHTDVVLEESIYSFYPFSENYSYHQTVAIAPGEYVFKITDKCGGVHDITISYNKYYTVKNFSYTTADYSDPCEEIILVYPDGEIYDQYEYLYPYAYFAIQESPDPNLAVGTVIEKGEYFLFSRAGKYVIEIREWWYGCGLDVITIDYAGNALALDGRSSYVCETGSSGHIRVKAKNGQPPYLYTLLHEDRTPVDIASNPNPDGEFEYGAFKEKYLVKIQDACGGSINVPVEINTLDQMTLLNGSTHVYRGETIELSCLILGATEYKWSGPLDFSENDRTVQVLNPTTENSGEYTVLVKPAGCNTFFEDKITIEVHDPPAPEVSDIPLCQADNDYQLSVEPLNSKYHIRWYDTNGEALPEAPSVDLSEPVEYTFDITHVETAYSYESDKTRLTVTVNPLPEKNAVASGWGCEDGRTEITVTEMIPNHVYNVFADAEATHLIHSFTGTADEKLSQTLPVKITKDTDFYLQVATESGCPLPPNVFTITSGVISGLAGNDHDVCYNTLPQTLTSMPATGGTGNYEYQWQQKNSDDTWTDLESGTGAETLSYSPDLLTATTVYRLKTIGGSNPCDTVFSNEVTVTVLPPFVPGTIAASQTVTSGQAPAALTSDIPVSGGDEAGGYVYQWQSLTGSGEWTDIAGAGGETYSPPSPDKPVQYRRKVTAGICGAAYSDTVTVIPVSRLSQQYIACENAAVKIGFKSAAGVTYYWYDAETGGIPITGGAPGDSILTVTKNADPVQTLWLEPRYKDVAMPRYPMALMLGDNCGTANPTGCAVDGTVIFREDFGGNSPSSPERSSTPLSRDIVDYTFSPDGSENILNEDAYAIAKTVAGNASVWHEGYGDHTYPADATRGYMLMANAGETAGKCYEYRIDGLCASAGLYFSAWLANWCMTEYSGDKDPYLKFELSDTEGNILAEYYTGKLPRTPNSAGLIWLQYGFKFSNPGNPSIIMRIYSIGEGGSGNDFVMDDIEIRFCAPKVNVAQPVSPESTVCAETPFTFEAGYDDDGTLGDNPVYRWEYNASDDLNNPDNWHVIEGTEETSATGNVHSTYPIASVDTPNTGYYRFAVANAENADSYNCRAMSDIIRLQVNKIILSTMELPVYKHNEAYSIQLESNAEEAVFSFTGDPVPGIDFTPEGLISGVVPVSAGFAESTFTVTVTDKNGCADSRTYRLRSCGPPPVTPRAEIQYCEGTQSDPLEASISGTDTEEPRLQWYSVEMIALPEAPTPSTTTLDDQIFYVTQISEILQCESGAAEIKVTVTPSPAPDFEASVEDICYGDFPVISLSNLHSDYTYNIYADVEMTEPLESFTEETSAEITLTTSPESNASYYILVIDNLECKAKEPVEISTAVTKLEISPERLPAYRHEIPYSVQLESNAEEAVFSLAGDLITGITFNPEGLISGMVPESEDFEESTFTVTVTDNNGCSAMREYTLSGCMEAPEVPHAEVSYCKGAQASPLEVTTLEGLHAQWYDAGQNALFDAPTPATVTDGEQVFYVSQISDVLQCESETTEIRVTITPLPEIDFSAVAKDACYEGAPSILLDDLRDNYSYYVYSNMTFSDTLGSLTEAMSGAVVLNDTITESTVYYILVTDSLGCASTDWIEVTAGVIKLYIEPDELPPYVKNTEYEQLLVTNAQSPIFAVIDGSLPDGLILNSSGLIYGNVPTSFSDLSNTVAVEVRDLNGCRAEREYTFNGNIFVPKIFTPNGDGINDIFMRGYELFVVDRLGVEIFRGDGGWDGTYKGMPVAEDIYFYTLEYVDSVSGDIKKTKGYVGVHR